MQRYREMQGVARVLDLTSLVVLDLPDGGLDDLDATDLDLTVRTHLERVRPDMVVTSAVHGISGHPGHIVSHEAVKRAEQALDCYVTYRHFVEEHPPLEAVTSGVPFDLCREAFAPPLGDLFDQLP